MSRADYPEIAQKTSEKDGAFVERATKLLPRQRKFAELTATGIPAGRAYEQAGYNSRGEVADSAATRLLANVQVASYVQELRIAAAESGRDAAILSIREKREYLARVVRAHVGDICPEPTDPTDENSTSGKNGDLVQEITRLRKWVGVGEEAEPWDVEKLKLPGKLEAIKLDSLLSGELVDPKRGDVNVSVNVTVSAEKIREIQDRRKAALALHGRN